MNKCVKITLKSCDTMTWREITKELRDIQYQTWKASNRAMTYYYSNDMQNMILKESGQDKIDEKKKYGKTFGAWVENRMNEIMDICNSSNVAQTRQFISIRYKNDKSKGLFKGNVSVSNFKRDMPIIVHNKNFTLSHSDKGYQVNISLFNRLKQKELDIKKVLFNIDKLDKSKKNILQKIIDKKYTQGSAQLSFDKKGKLYLTISFSFEKEIEEELDKNKILGIDLGIVKLATMSIYNLETETYENLSWKESIIDGSELIHFRQKVDSRKKGLSIASKWCGQGRIGHGYKTRTKPVNDIGNKVARFRDTYNHKISRYIVDLAFKTKCKTIQLENLSGFSVNTENIFLKNWSYYDLQTKIKYKAEEFGIEVILINPQYTSKRCSKCGNIHEDNRDCKTNQAKFKCITCGHEENADINASKNIAIPYIDKIIEEYLKENKKIKD